MFTFATVPDLMLLLVTAVHSALVGGVVTVLT